MEVYHRSLQHHYRTEWHLTHTAATSDITTSRSSAAIVKLTCRIVKLTCRTANYVGIIGDFMQKSRNARNRATGHQEMLVIEDYE